MIDWTEILIRLSLAALLGAAIGLERERKNWAAGLRTHMMVCVGAALAMLVSTYGFVDVMNEKGFDVDPSRIAAQVISGIGFIGAGTIMFLSKGVVRGLTTAAGLWTVAAIGLATGSGMFLAAIITTLLAIIILFLLQPIERKFANQFKNKVISIKFLNREQLLSSLTELIHKEEYLITNFNVQQSAEDLTFEMTFNHSSTHSISQFIRELEKLSTIKEVKWDEN